MTSNRFTTGSFESFNARALTPQQVAATFIPPAQFKDLSKRCHSLVIGPRGSGKTTMLKMLQPAALNAWTGSDAFQARETVDFAGVFVPTDISWQKQAEAMAAWGLSVAEIDVVTGASFAAHVLRCFVATLGQGLIGQTSSEPRNYLPMAISRADESQLASNLASMWSLQGNFMTLGALRVAMAGRIRDINSFINRESVLNSATRNDRFEDLPYLHDETIDLLSIGLDIVEDLVPSMQQHRWALLFDELELAPAVVRRRLLSIMRSVDERLLIKLSVSPYHEDFVQLRSVISAMPGNDFNEIFLTFGRRDNESANFSRRLFESIAESRGFASKTPEELFGRSVFEAPNVIDMQEESVYSSKGAVIKSYRKLASNDKTFREYLGAAKIDLNRPELLSSSGRAATLRKIRSLVAVRSEFRNSDTDYTRTGRQRRVGSSSRLYQGGSSLLTMVDGNPRWLIGIANGIFDRLAPDNRVSPSAQYREIRRAFARFRALLRTIPVISTPQTSRGVLTLLDGVGEYIFQRVVLEPFDDDAPGSFIIDSSASPALLDALGKALNAGAIIYLPDEDSEDLLSSLKGKRFRLCYLLASYYKIPLRLGRGVALSAMLGVAADNHPEFAELQGKLFQS